MSESFGNGNTLHRADDGMGAIPGVRMRPKEDVPWTGSGAAVLYSQRAADLRRASGLGARDSAIVQVSHTFYSPSLTAQCAEVDIDHDLIMIASAGVRPLNSRTFAIRALGVIRNALQRHPGINPNKKRCVSKTCGALYDHGKIGAKASNPSMPINHLASNQVSKVSNAHRCPSCLKFAVAKALAFHGVEAVGIGIGCGYDDSLYQGIVYLGYYTLAEPVTISSASKAAYTPAFIKSSSLYSSDGFRA